jgi:hypothetical protein
MSLSDYGVRDRLYRSQCAGYSGSPLLQSRLSGARLVWFLPCGPYGQYSVGYRFDQERTWPRTRVLYTVLDLDFIIYGPKIESANPSGTYHDHRSNRGTGTVYSRLRASESPPRQ